MMRSGLAGISTIPFRPSHLSRPAEVCWIDDARHALQLDGQGIWRWSGASQLGLKELLLWRSRQAAVGSLT